MEMDYLFTDKTKAIYENLKANGFHIELEINQDLLGKKSANWGMLPTFKIIAPDNSTNITAFTHELLHIQLFNNGFFDSNTVRYIVDKNGEYLSGELLEKINNNLAHLRMLPIFINLGFNKNDFLHGEPEKQLEQTLDRIKELSLEKNNHLRLQKIICEYSIVKYYENFENLNTKECMDYLKNLDIDLFPVIENSFTDWIKGNNDDNIKFFSNLKSGIENLIK